MFCSLPYVSFSVANAFNCAPIKSASSEHEMLLVNAPHHQFSISNLTKLFYESQVEKPVNEQIDYFVKEFNQIKPLWRPVSYVQEQGGYASYQIHLFTNVTTSNLIHTGPWKMRIGESVYVIPPLHTVTGQLTDNSPYSYKYKANMKTYTNPFLISDTEFHHFKMAWQVDQVNNILQKLHGEDNDCSDTDEEDCFYISNLMKDPHADELAKNLASDFNLAIKNSNLAQVLQKKNLSKLKGVSAVRPIGEIVGKRDDNPYNVSCQNEICTGDRFTIRWYDN